jgi:hypothetical protein
MSQNSLLKLQEERAETLREIASIERLRRGHISEQFVQGKHGRRGPYPVFQRWEKGRNRCRRVPAEEIGPLREQVHNYKRFEQLSDRLAQVIERITELCEGDSDSKKNSRRPATNAARRPKRSGNSPSLG